MLDCATHSGETPGNHNKCNQTARILHPLKPVLSKKYEKQTNPKEVEDHNNNEIKTKETHKVKITRDPFGNKIVNNYVVIKTIGIGTFSKVKLALNTDDNQLYAIKEMKKKHLSKKRFGMRKATALDDILREISIMKKLHHRNILHLHEVINDPKEDRLFLVIEYADGGPVMKGELEAEPLPERKARAFITDVVNGLEYMHHNKIVHRDIKVTIFLFHSIRYFSVCIYECFTHLLSPKISYLLEIRSRYVTLGFLCAWKLKMVKKRN